MPRHGASPAHLHVNQNPDIYSLQAQVELAEILKEEIEKELAIPEELPLAVKELVEVSIIEAEPVVVEVIEQPEIKINWELPNDK